MLCLPPEDARHPGPAVAVPARDVRPTESAEGELFVRGPNVFAGYWATPKRRRGPRDGWLLTGDSPSATPRATTASSAGSRTCSSRAARTSTRPRSRPCSRHPAVQGAAVVGVPDERWGEVGARSWCPRRLDEDELVASARAARPLQGARLRRLRRRASSRLDRQDRHRTSWPREEVRRDDATDDVSQATAARSPSAVRHAPACSRRRSSLRRRSATTTPRS